MSARGTRLGPGAPADIDGPKVSFAFNTASPVDFGSLVSGDEVVEAQIIIDTPFDDAGALLALGLASAPGGILPTNMVDPQAAGTYHSGELHPVAASDSIRLQITPGTSTQGAGRVIVRVRNA